MKSSIGRSILSFITLIVLSVLGIKTEIATATSQIERQTVNNETVIGQACPYGGNRLRYGRVATLDGDDLYIRSRPNGKVIGAVPFGWAVVTVKRDSTQKWVYIDEYPAVSAPALRSGWVAAKYIKPLGRFCEKPMSLIRTNMNGLFANKKIVVNENWVQIGDRISTQVNS
ncbi:SH3 domain-containing protein [Aliterella atlantica]|uniref:Uncharacterized protein n=1 Tax=Aliterella atlantica CENA595 TaxID=1618023 RepID=A0A0D8ZX83_9CYAN|nr:SH3 domain-containing protein [Aliterella atlantica]KJH73373.1 hypothetical protein UH38_00910 [Aliterella atlantica CENA595]